MQRTDQGTERAGEMLDVLPAEHPQRRVLADEVHARPYSIIEAPLRATYVAVLVEHRQRDAERQRIAELCQQFGVAGPSGDTIHFTASLADLFFQWERHGEFSGYTMLLPGSGPTRFSDTALMHLPSGWLRDVPGQCICAVHAEFVAYSAATADNEIISSHFDGIPVGSRIGEGAGEVYTDFRVHADGCTRYLILSQHLSPREGGRMLQRLFEIEAYRMLALLALPIARRLSSRVHSIESALTKLTNAIAGAGGDDEALLHELTTLAAEVESSLASIQSRFAASRAYYDLVKNRIHALREQRLEGAQTIQGFMARRLAPAMSTCTAISERLLDLSERVAQASSLLSTRVDISRSKQNRDLLASMERRARQQVRLQETVEGLSVTAITYYVVGLIAYATKGLKASGFAIMKAVEPDLVVGIAIPLTALLVAYGVRRIRRHIVAAEIQH